MEGRREVRMMVVASPETEAPFACRAGSDATCFDGCGTESIRAPEPDTEGAESRLRAWLAKVDR
ncbi:MAG: hypothetical protein JXA15_03770 [Spirochaetales bacterium]|nr:hypothetical protein [Spirochaetales bacterium]